MPRYRITYEKRDSACFVPHIVLPTVFARAAGRASHSENGDCELEPIIFQMTEGFSPHAKMSFASELPVGVVALKEPVDMWLINILSDSQFESWSKSLPKGFKLISFFEVPEGSPSISKSCHISEYLLKVRSADKVEPVKNILLDLAENMTVSSGNEGEFFRFAVDNHAVTLGVIVKKLISENAVEGWHELCIVRVRVGGVE
ncbi:MAG: TIGR03936 family radical SAM-associated protein [Synergistaceae bacterium]|nr:TIGR03936 family radical SAM-associated protein [Synergistaceae bacterium]